MTKQICKFCNKDRSGEKFHICHKKAPHDCAKDGHVPKSGLITMFKCIKCDYIGELAPELIPSETELAVREGYSSETEETL